MNAAQQAVFAALLLLWSLAGTRAGTTVEDDVAVLAALNASASVGGSNGIASWRGTDPCSGRYQRKQQKNQYSLAATINVCVAATWLDLLLVCCQAGRECNALMGE